MLTKYEPAILEQVPVSPYEFDILQLLLKDSRSPNTQRAYLADLNLFFRYVVGQEASPQYIQQFLSLPKEQALTLVLRFKGDCIERGLKEATINRRLAAIKSLIKMGERVGVCSFTLDNLKSEKILKYRDTSGVSIDVFKEALRQVNQDTIAGKRDYALLHLLWSNGLRRGEIVKLTVGDFDPINKTLRIFGKGRGTQSELIGLANSTVKAIQNWLSVNGSNDSSCTPLFSSLHAGYKDKPLTGDAIYKLVKKYFNGEKLPTGEVIQEGVTTKRMSPHRIRHSAITAALDASKGNVRDVQKFSRHKNIETLMIYDDNRTSPQLDISQGLANALD